MKKINLQSDFFETEEEANEFPQKASIINPEKYENDGVDSVSDGYYYYFNGVICYCEEEYEEDWNVQIIDDEYIMEPYEMWKRIMFLHKKQENNELSEIEEKEFEELKNTYEEKAKETNWLNITKDEFNLIKSILER